MKTIRRKDKWSNCKVRVLPLSRSAHRLSV